MDINIYQQFIEKYSFLRIEILSNSLGEWLAAVMMFFAALFFIKIIKIIIVSKLEIIFKKTKTKFDDMIIKAIKNIHWFFYVIISAYFGMQFLNISSRQDKWAYIIFLIALLYYLVLFFQSIIDLGSKKIADKKEQEGEDSNLIKFFASVLKIVLWIPVVLMVLSGLGYNITSLIAGLGIGGIAIALALQNILGDLFSSLTIYFDKPFKQGDFVIIGDKMGNVKSVGMKSTRIILLQGEELVVSNTELTNSQIRNFGKLERRRIVFTIGVTYDTPQEKLMEIIEIIKNAVKIQDLAELDRCHFSSFGDSSLIFETVFYIKSSEYLDYMNTQQNINLEILKQFEKIGVEIAFPSRTIYLKNEK